MTTSIFGAAVIANNTAPAVYYGQYGDGGQTDDPTVDATAYNAGTVYSYGDMVSYLGSYYICIARPTYANWAAQWLLNVLPNSDVTRWWPVSSIAYVDNTVAPGGGVLSAVPATAKANPFQSGAEIYVLTRGTSAGTTPRYTLILWKRGQTYPTNIQLAGTNGGNHALFFIGAWGSRSAARPIIELRDNNIISSVNTIFGPTVSGNDNHAGDTGYVRQGFIGAGGTGYTLGDVLTPVGGTFTVAATFTVTGVSAGVVTDIAVLVAGSYTAPPADLFATTGGTGTGCTLSVRTGPISVANHYAGFQVRNITSEGLMSFFLTVTPVSSVLTAGDTILGATSLCVGTIIAKVGNYCQISYLQGTGDTVHGFFKNETVTVTAGTNVGATATLPNSGWTGASGPSLYNSQDTGFPAAAVVNSDCKNMSQFGVGAGYGNRIIGGSGDNFFLKNSYMYNCMKLGAGASGLSGNGSACGVSYGDGCAMIYNTFASSGNGATSHNIYNIGLSNHVFKYNRSVFSQGYGYNIHDLCFNLSITDNIFDGNNNGVGHQAGYPAAHEGILTEEFKRNFILNSGTAPGNLQGYGMIADICKNMDYMCNVFAGNLLGDASFQTSVISGTKQPNTNIRYYFNSHYQSGSSYYGLYLSANGKNFNGGSCVFHTLGTNAGSNKSCFVTDLVTADLVTWDRNTYYAPVKTAGQLQQCIIWATTNYTLPAYLAGPGAGNAIDDNSVYADPKYLDVAAQNLRVIVGSPAILLGRPASGAGVDAAGRAKNNAFPTAGAYEYP